MTNARHARSADLFATTRIRLDRAIESCWLAAIVLTAVAFNGRMLFFHTTQPKQHVLHLFALAIICLWATEIALSPRGYAQSEKLGAKWKIWQWARRDLAKWMLVFAGAFALAQLLATMFSPYPSISLFGRDLNSPGYELYSGLSYLTIFAAIALRVRTFTQVKRLLGAIAATGVLVALYGNAQHFGWDPSGYAAGAGRVPSSFGNPIFFASFLIMSLFATLSLFLLSRGGTMGRWTWVAAIGVGIQLSAVWFTGSRGPLVAVIVGGLVTAIACLALLDRRQILRVAAASVAGSTLAVLIIVLPAPNVSGGRSGTAIIGSILGQAAAVTGTEVSLTNEGLASDNVGQRTSIWQGALELIRTRESVERPGAFVKAVRHMFGLGQDMYYYSYPLTSPIQQQFRFVSHAHNYVLQIWLEIGLVGLVSLIGVSVSAALLLLQNAWSTKKLRVAGTSSAKAVVIVGLLGLLAARATEQVPGVAQVADLTAFWACMGLLIAISRVDNLTGHDRKEPAKNIRARPHHSRLSSDEYRPLRIGCAIGLAILAATLWVAIDGTALNASRLAARANHQFNLGNTQDGYLLIKRAADSDTFSEQYGLIAAQMELNAANIEADAQRRLSTLLVAYGTLAEYEKTAPLAVNNSVRLLAVTGAIAEIDAPRVTDELRRRTVALDYRMRPFPQVMAFLANSYGTAGEFELAIEVAEYAVDIGRSVGIEVPQAWWAKGEALGRLDRVEEALESLVMATEVEPDSQFAALSHRTLAAYYDSIGDTDEAQAHTDRAEEIERSLMAE